MTLADKVFRDLGQLYEFYREIQKARPVKGRASGTVSRAAEGGTGSTKYSATTDQTNKRIRDPAVKKSHRPSV